ncbi:MULTISPECIES: SycD/LcrH family type III secretion system chaperone [Pseudomonas]|jgi:type III secretion system low calcium response chaperone LcrH/SycD|uniref:CesD/SycD/LcrH family type III secretion system chaperone n=1 Tax=Pseudomonas weihenstephanensis TaxID=1608994 RepID=A0A0J6IYP4_9PSED|nr:MULTISPECIES: SycD/LcrH family type III secretion system chaperone [Pseudomonas]GLX89428.1 CesD/SycD/LcrH family type III secretion system chaperone [Pseudomonas fragi]KMN14281.1 Low calcium response locus protein H [Pseudomonas weihenstephanensis]KMN17329.1 Low calcium response locus protein H [Pseudomonas weihenstephanensis]KVV01238.1 Chaperone protein IpgC [Pseudomonas sp. TAD18]KVV06323.1 Chaperone protein IpgC [Pseudomonas sp. TAA207]
MTQPTQDACEQEMEAFLRDGGTLAMLRDVSADSLEQLYSLAFNDYQAGKWETAHKVFQALCMLDHYDVRFFLGLGACRQSMGQFEQAVQSYSYGAVIDVNEPRFPFHAAECHLQLGDLDGAESGFYSARALATAHPEHAALAERAGALLEAVLIRKDQQHDSNSD